MPSSINLGHLYDVIITRDTWLHTLDIARATGREVDLAAPCHRRLVEDVVGEWARRHGQAFDLRLTGPAGGHYCQGSGAEPITMDAVDFVRVLSGRAEGTGLLATRVVF